MKVLVTALIVMFAFSIIFASSQDAFAQIKPRVASVDLVKTVDKPLVPSGTLVTYTYTMTNTGTFDLLCFGSGTSLVDDKLGTIPMGNNVLLKGQTKSFTKTTTITTTTTNTATLTCKTDSSVPVSDVSSSLVEVFVPSVEVIKTGDTLSKIGDDVQYDFTITNTGTSNSPNLILDSILDSLLGDLADDAPAACDSIAPGDSCLFSVTRTVLAGDPNPLVNTVTVHYHPDGFENDITDSDDHSVNLFVPSVQVTKTGDTVVNLGDDVDYDFTITNTGPPGSPDLILDSVSDDVFGDLADDAPAACDILAPGDSCSFSVTRTALITDPNPLVNTVTVHYHPEGFPNDVTDSDTHSVTIIVTPTVDVVKIADPTLIEAGETVTYTVDITNTGPTTLTGCEGTDDNGTPFDTSDDIDVDALDIGPFSLAPGESKTFTYSDEIFVDTTNIVTFLCFGPDNTPVGDSDTAHVTVLVVGGNYMQIDSAALILAGIQTNAVWLVPTMAGLAGIGLYLVKFRVREN